MRNRGTYDCLECHADVTATLASGRTVCPACGATVSYSTVARRPIGTPTMLHTLLFASIAGGLWALPFGLHLLGRPHVPDEALVAMGLGCVLTGCLVVWFGAVRVARVQARAYATEQSRLGRLDTFGSCFFRVLLLAIAFVPAWAFVGSLMIAKILLFTA